MAEGTDGKPGKPDGQNGNKTEHDSRPHPPARGSPYCPRERSRLPDERSEHGELDHERRDPERTRDGTEPVDPLEVVAVEVRLGFEPRNVEIRDDRPPE